ncbi:peregrin-like isoform X10 [Dinothrombium tinctorium]|uniref:Peregrin-like isoform X10 n=1 Tax=Dinothrombium tinctorium TaxID=1965070 RepID=A0A3S3P4G1_9ACAR|nr:peregrin-like isoform X10 [Dinothrombium tinctorium]RWS14766.1 peregrin-like isoform X10 [Dinothrombium tinctorium]RWS14870.1 peregrin-like isoform X10 [Dinothrombium tinctorium]
MVLDFDTREFLQNLKATKPPYECPIVGCAKIYKSFAGIEHHLYQSHAGNDSSSARKSRSQNQRQSREKSPTPTNLLRTPAREALTYAEAQRMIEVDIDGSTHRINIYEPLNIIYIDGKNGFNVDAVIDSKNNNEVKATKNETSNGKGKNKEKTKSGKASKRNNTAASGVESQNPEPVKLPEPSFRIIENYTAPEAPPRPSSYFRYIDKSQEELDEEVEYDMDEEDCAWLELINKKRKSDGLTEVPPDTFELLMDRLEKESYFLSQNSGKDMGPAIDEDAVCCICNDGECQNTNAILFCDMCNLAVHQECYGVPYIPEGQWLCRRCLQSPSRAVDCVLCPNKGGAFKQTDDNRWTHVVCALWIPEVCFANTVFLEPIDSIGNIPPARWRLTCYICKQRNVGACIQCHKTNCYVAFHVTCAQQAGLYMKMEAIEELTTAGIQRSVRKTAYCLTHTPSDENGTILSGVYQSGDDDDSRSSAGNKKQQLTEAAFKEKMKKARKILAEKRSALPVVSIPTIPPDRLTKTAAMINIPKRNQFIQRLLGYWTLKRQSRNGVPLLRRLQITYTGAKRGEETRDDDEQAKKMREELKCLQRLRQDLERARLLIELIRKREKLKREYIKVMQLTVETQLRPFSLFLRKVLNLLEAKDAQKIFAEPVNVKEVPDYLDFVKNPMDFSTMRTKINNNQYTSFTQFEADFHLIIDNCMFYNEKDTVYYKAALRLRDGCKNILKEAKQQMLKIGYNEAAGIHYPPTSIEEPKDSLTRVANEQRRLEAQLTQLNEELNKAQQAKSGGSKTKKIQLLTTKIASVKREMSLLNPTGFNLPAIDSSKNLSQQEPNKQSDNSAKLIENIIQNRSPKNGMLFNLEPGADISLNASPLKTEGRRTMNSVTLTADASTCTPSNMFSVSSEALKDKTNRVKKRSTKNHGSGRSKKAATEANSLQSLNTTTLPFPNAPLPQTDSFKVYRSNRPTSRSSRSDVSIESQHRIPLEPLDLVWAKCRGYPWYPALIVNPDMPKTGYFHNGVPIPVPPDDVLALKKNYNEPVYLVLFFDAKRTWQWLPRNKLEPLGVNQALDKAKLTESRKQTERKAVKKAFEKAILHRCRVTGESTDLSGDSSNED